MKKRKGKRHTAEQIIKKLRGDDYDGHPEKRFKNRRFSRDGKPVAQQLFDEISRRGEFVRLLKWEHNQSREMEVANES